MHTVAKKDTYDHRPVTPEDFDAAMRQILLAAKPSDQRREDRMPTKAELDARYRLERRASK